MEKKMMGSRMKETVLYYNPGNSSHVIKLKGVLVQMGIRIKQIGPEQINGVVGALLGMEGLDTEESSNLEETPKIQEEMLVMYRFSSQRVDDLLRNLRRAGVPKINLKAVVTEHNCKWSFYKLYQELKDEHEKMEQPS